jgi:pimeloyl-ACP methyl ester carboxylesterase
VCTSVQNRADQQITLSDGRKLGFAEYGLPGAYPVFYFHGWPGSRLEPQATENREMPPAARIIAVDRPGYGLSDLQPKRTFSKWAGDVNELAARLHLKSFGVMGVSGGGPYALACAARLPEQVSVACVIAGMGPVDNPEALKGMVALNRWMLGLARTAPWLARTLVGFGLDRMQHSDEFLSPYITSRLPPSDKAVLQKQGIKEALVRNWHEAFRNGTEGALVDGALFAHRWDFSLSEIKVPVRLWHGEADIIVPGAMTRQIAAGIADCRATFLPDEGHFSAPILYIRQVLETAVALK